MFSKPGHTKYATIEYKGILYKSQNEMIKNNDLNFYWMFYCTDFTW